MTKVTAEMVNELRKRTGVSMAKCKEALEVSHGDMEKAIDHLRKTGVASAVKKEGRETKEGLIGTAESDKAIALVEVNAETDFVTQNEKFREFLRNISEQAAHSHPKDVDAFIAEKSRHDKSMTLDEYRADIVQSLGENIKIKRLHILPKNANHSIGFYSHMGGKIVTVVDIAGAPGQEALARDIAMHIAAESPEYLNPEDVPEDVKEREKDVARGQVQGKPPQIVDKIVEGKIKSFYDQVCLNCQKYVKDNTLTIGELVAREGKRLGKPLQIRGFVRWKVGD